MERGVQGDAIHSTIRLTSKHHYPMCTNHFFAYLDMKLTTFTMFRIVTIAIRKKSFFSTPQNSGHEFVPKVRTVGILKNATARTHQHRIAISWLKSITSKR